MLRRAEPDLAEKGQPPGFFHEPNPDFLSFLTQLSREAATILLEDLRSELAL
jgi:hypothetical protein